MAETYTFIIKNEISYQDKEKNTGVRDEHLLILVDRFSSTIVKVVHDEVTTETSIRKVENNVLLLACILVKSIDSI